MDAICLHINSMTHHAIAARREAFVAKAVGLEMTLVAQPNPKDVRCVGAFVDALRIGNVRSDDAMLAQRVLLGSGRNVVTGRIVRAEAFELLTDLGAVPLASEEEVARALPLGLGGWTTSVAPLAPTVPLPQEVETMEKLFWTYFDRGKVESVVAVVDRLFEIMRYDLSGEMQSQRLLMYEALSGADDERLRHAAERLTEASQRMGGEHQMAEIGQWLKDELSLSFEADQLLYDTPWEVTRAQVVKEAQALPGKLYGLWLTDTGAFARVLYGMRLPRADVRRVLACLLWLELKEEEEVEEEQPTESAAPPTDEPTEGSSRKWSVTMENHFSGPIQNMTITE